MIRALLAGALLIVALAAWALWSRPVGAMEPCRQMLASWYGPGFHGRPTASGQKFNQNAMTAAHKTLPFGTKLKVIYRGRQVDVRINDRGPYHGKRELDLSAAAAAKIGLNQAGVDHVKVCPL